MLSYQSASTPRSESILNEDTHHMNRFKLLVALTVILCFFASCKQTRSAASAESQPPPISKVPSQPDGLPNIDNPQPSGSVDHDTDAFTQGLLFLDGKLYESTGRVGHSKVRRLNPETGEVEAETDMNPEFFGEGLAFFKDRFYQLTYRAGVCVLYNKELEPQGELFYGTEGWGLAVDPDNELLIFTDGSDQLRFLKPENLTTATKLQVVDGSGNPVPRLNELEWVNGEIWANIWTSDAIARIDPKSGKVVGWIHLTDLVKQHQEGYEEVLNGIAYDDGSDTLWLTGKFWPKIYRFDNVKSTFFQG